MHRQAGQRAAVPESAFWPAGEVAAEVVPDGGCEDERGRQHIGEPVERTEDLADLPVFPWQGWVPASMPSRMTANHEPC